MEAHKLIGDEWRRLRLPGGALLGMLAIFAVVFYLYGVPTEPVFYALFLSLFVGLLFLIFDIICYLRKFEQLQVLRAELEGNYKKMPKARDGIEKQYQEILMELYEKMKELDARWSLSYEESMEYYTVWAHQIKTPISAMRLLLQAGEPLEGQRLEIELFKIEQYVEMALGYLRTEDMSRDLQIRQYDLDTIIKQAVKSYAKFFILNKISLHYEPVNTQVITDEKWLLFVLKQILSNAIKYTRPGGTISIYLENPGDKTLVIEDTGIGISSQDLPRVCERGFTGYNGREDKQATGIGLYSAKKVMDRLSHGLYLTSRMNVGTKVYLKLDREKLDLV